jgi:branched-chain amino acid transport system permease protein
MSTTEQAHNDQGTAGAPAPPSSTLLGRAMAAAPSGGPIGRGGSTLLRNLVITVVCVGLVMGATTFLEPFQNFQLAYVLAYLSALIGLNVLIGLNGQLSLGHGAIMAVGGYSMGFTQNALVDAGFVDTRAFALGWTILISLTVGVLAAILAGLLIGLAAARLRGPYLAGVTLAVAVVVPGITTVFDAFNGDQGIRVSVPRKPAGLAKTLGASFTNEQWQAWVALFAVGLVGLLMANLIRSRYGRMFKAVRDDEVAAQLSGINVARTQITAFVVSAATAGLAGGVFVFLVKNAQPGFFSLNLSLYLVLALVLGGLGSISGAIWGALFLVIVPFATEQLSRGMHVPADLELRLIGNLPLAIFGLALIVVTIIAPGGIQALVRRIGAWLRGLVRRPAG